MKKATIKNYRKIIADAAKGHGITRVLLQTVAVLCISEANRINAKTGKVNGNYTPANDLVGSKDFAGLSMKAVQVYLEAHADMKWERTSDGNKFVSQRTAKYVVPKLSDKTWFEFSQSGEATVTERTTVLGAFVKRFEGIVKGTGKTTFVKADQKKAEANLVSLKVMLAA